MNDFRGRVLLLGTVLIAGCSSIPKTMDEFRRFGDSNTNQVVRERFVVKKQVQAILNSLQAKIAECFNKPVEKKTSVPGSHAPRGTAPVYYETWYRASLKPLADHSELIVQHTSSFGVHPMRPEGGYYVFSAVFKAKGGETQVTVHRYESTYTEIGEVLSRWIKTTPSGSCPEPE